MIETKARNAEEGMARFRMITHIAQGYDPDSPLSRAILAACANADIDPKALREGILRTLATDWRVPLLMRQIFDVTQPIDDVLRWMAATRQ